MHNRFLQTCTNSFLIGSFLLSAAGQLGRIEPSPGVSIYLYEPFLFVGFILLVIQLNTVPFQKLLLLHFGKRLVWFIAWLAFTLVLSLFFFSQEENIVAFFYFMRLCFYFFFILYFLAWVLKKRITDNALHLSIVIYFLFLAVSAGAQYFLYPDLRNLMYNGWDPHYYRVFGTYFEPVMFATITGLFGLYFLYLNKLLYLPLIVLSLVGVVVSFSRAVYLGILASLFAYFRHAFPWKEVVAVIAFAIVVFTFVPKPAGEGVNLLRTSTIASRSEDYMQGFILFLKNPVTGIGYNHIGAVKKVETGENVETNHAAASFHSSFLIILVTAGILGLLLYLTMLISLMKINTFFLVSGIFLFIVALFDNVLLHPFILITWVFLGSRFIHPSRT